MNSTATALAAAERPAAACTPATFKSGTKPIWCPGCGDYSVLSSITKAFAMLALKPEETVVVAQHVHHVGHRPSPDESEVCPFSRDFSNP